MISNKSMLSKKKGRVPRIRPFETEVQFYFTSVSYTHLCCGDGGLYVFDPCSLRPAESRENVYLLLDRGHLLGCPESDLGLDGLIRRGSYVQKDY